MVEPFSGNETAAGEHPPARDRDGGYRADRKITAATILAGRERRADTPAQARNFLDAMRGLFSWAHEAQHVKADPTVGVKNPPRKAGPGFADVVRGADDRI